MQGPAGASPDARAAGGVGQSQGRGRGGREDESHKYAGREGAEEAMEQLEAAGRGFAPATVPSFRRRAGWYLRVTAAVRLCSPVVPTQCGQDIHVDGRGISTRGDCVIACGSALLLPACAQHRVPALLPALPVIAAQAPMPPASLLLDTAARRQSLPGPGGTEGQLPAPGKSENHGMVWAERDLKNHLIAKHCRG